MPPSSKSAPVARGPGSLGVRRALAGAAALYCAGVWLDAVGAPLAGFVPRPLLYFMQVAALFPHALTVSTEYHARAYACDEKSWVELDVRRFFPLRADDKENRFERAMFFYHYSGVVLKALDDYIVAANNTGGRPAIGGVALLSLRIPIPPPGTAAAPYRHRPVDDYPIEYRKYWYRTPAAQARARCAETVDRHGLVPPH